MTSCDLATKNYVTAANMSPSSIWLCEVTTRKYTHQSHHERLWTREVTYHKCFGGTALYKAALFSYLRSTVSFGTTSVMKPSSGFAYIQQSSPQTSHTLSHVLTTIQAKIYYRTSLAKILKIIVKRFDNHSVVFISGGYKNRR